MKKETKKIINDIIYNIKNENLSNKELKDLLTYLINYSEKEA